MTVFSVISCKNRQITLYFPKNSSQYRTKGPEKRCPKSKQRFMYRPSFFAGVLCSKSKNPKSRDYCISLNIAFVIQIVLCSTREYQIQYHAYTSSRKLNHRQYAECFHRHSHHKVAVFSILIIIRGVNNLLFSICVIYGALEVKGCQSNMHQTDT